MLSIKQIGTVCFAISLLISAPLFAIDIPSSASTANCKYSPLQVYSGQSNLEANWEPNVIQITWYNGDDQYASNSCTYGGNLTMPSNIPTREGYTFRGWRVRQSGGGQQAQQCSLSGLDTTIPGTWEANKCSTGYCFYHNEDTGYESTNCSDSHITGLNNGEWEAGFSYGTVKGTSYCSGKSGDSHDTEWGGNSSDWVATENELTSAGNGQYCWCHVTSYTPTGEYQCNVAFPSWVFFDSMGGNCANYCAGYCSSYVVIDGWTGISFRRALFGVSQ